MKMNNYTMPRLCGSDIARNDWYVYFYYTDLQTKVKKMFRYKMDINRIKTVRGRKDRASKIISALTKNLESGWNPISNKIESSAEDLTVTEAMFKLFEIKKSYLRKASIRSYYNQIDMFTRWLKREKLDHLYVTNFTKQHFRAYCDYLLGERKHSGKTFNTHVTTMRIFFNDMIDRKYIDVSPALGIKKAREEVGKNTTYDEREEKLFETIKDKEPHFYLATRFVKYCFLRRTELARVQVKHLNWDNKTIIIPAANSKTRTQDSVTIPRTLEKLIQKSGFLDLDPETFLFSRNFEPSNKELNRIENFSDKQRELNDELGIKKECTFYTWKHTGVVELYNLTKDPYTVMRQCRHSNIKMTMVYLRSLGLGVNEQVREW